MIFAIGLYVGLMATDNPSHFAPGDGRQRGPGPAPGTGGATPSQVRAASRAAYAARVHLLEAIADGKALPFTKRVKLKQGKGKTLPSGVTLTPDQVAAQIAEGDEYLTVTWEESAEIPERLKAIEKLGSFGGMTSTSILDDEGKAMKPVYTIGFD